MKNPFNKSFQLFTIGHSNRAFDEFLSLLKKFQIETVVDIRRYPSSRKFPHFNRETLQKLLTEHGIEYLWLEALGGRRHGGQNEKSPNLGLTSPAFRSYADYMATDQFRTAVKTLLSTFAASRTAIMCAEKLYWKCHRRLLCDYLTAQSIEVKHIMEEAELIDHKLTPSAVISADFTVTYPTLALSKRSASKGPPIAPDNEKSLFDA
jgi:uncharacterized protein (DUF488 family)